MWCRSSLHRNTKMHGKWVVVFVAAIVLPNARARPDGAATNLIQGNTVKKSDLHDKVEKLKPNNEVIDTRPVHERFPHAVLFSPNCGGTIISPTWILTAGHCSLKNRNRYVLAGTSVADKWKGIVRHVKRYVIHPLFSVGPYWLKPSDFNITQVAARYDFLLAELTVPLPLDGKNIAAAKLNDLPTLPAGLNVAFAGYGTDHFGGYMRRRLHEMNLEVQADEVCSSLTQYNPHDMMCAKGRPPRYDSTCNGDSGSGLVDETGRLVGIVSWAQDDARRCFNGALVVFSRVSSVREWIRAVTNV